MTFSEFGLLPSCLALRIQLSVWIAGSVFVTFREFDLFPLARATRVQSSAWNTESVFVTFREFDRCQFHSVLLWSNQPKNHLPDCVRYRTGLIQRSLLSHKVASPLGCGAGTSGGASSVYWRGPLPRPVPLIGVVAIGCLGVMLSRGGIAATMRGVAELARLLNVELCCNAA